MRLIVATDTGLLKSVQVERKSASVIPPAAAAASAADVSADAASGAAVRVQDTAFSQLRLSPDGTAMYAASLDGRLARLALDPPAGPNSPAVLKPPEVLLRPATSCVSMEVDARNNLLAMCDADGVVRYYDAAKVAEAKAELKAHVRARRMRMDPDDGSRFAIGGEKADLRIWDINRPDAAIFQAKNVHHDMLKLEVPVHITDMAFTPGSGGHEIFTVTAHRHLRIYDTRKQRRPVQSIEYGEYALNSVQPLNDPHKVAVADAAGNVIIIDTRTLKHAGNFKGHTGAVRSMSLHPTLPYLACVGLDRHVRVFNVKTHKPEFKIYLKQRLNAVAFTNELQQKPESEESQQQAGTAQAAEIEEDDDDQYLDAKTVEEKVAEDDALWASLALAEEEAEEKASPSKKVAKRKSTTAEKAAAKTSKVFK